MTGAGTFTSRDVGAIDAVGRVAVHGRSDDGMISGGENISAAEVTAVPVCPSKYCRSGRGGRRRPSMGSTALGGGGCQSWFNAGGGPPSCANFAELF